LKARQTRGRSLLSQTNFKNLTPPSITLKTSNYWNLAGKYKFK